MAFGSPDSKAASSCCMVSLSYSLRSDQKLSILSSRSFTYAESRHMSGQTRHVMHLEYLVKHLLHLCRIKTYVWANNKCNASEQQDERYMLNAKLINTHHSS